MRRFFFFVLLCSSGLLFQSDLLHAQSNADCFACHSDKSLSQDKHGTHRSLFVDEQIFKKSVHASLDCTSCHEGFTPENIPHRKNIRPVNCTACHDEAVAKHPFHPQLAQAIASHQEPDVSCKDCHGMHDVASPKTPGSKFSAGNIGKACGECHSDVVEKFAASAHGKALSEKEPGAPSCMSCHSNNITRNGSSPDSLAHVKLAQEQLCISCHLDNPEVRAKTSPSAKFITSYDNSVHGSALHKGNGKAANCVDCHGSHEMKKGLEPTATVNRTHIAETCAKCHQGIAQDYNQSVHGVAVANGVKDAPTCTSCHGEHTIYKHDDPRSPVAAKNISAQVCSPCHSSLTLTAKYGMQSDRFKTFSDSYHGLAIRGGSVQVANCASCHGSHNISPSNDPASTINKANLPTTCGKCHPGANERFGMGAVHVSMAAKQDPLLYWIANAYILLIIVTIGGMLLHNVLDFIRKSQHKLSVRRGLLPQETHSHRLYLRMTLNERMQHVALFTSFFTLVITGFMLRFPEAWWVQAIRSLNDKVFDFRSIIHRLAGVVMILASFYHIYYIAFTERGRQLIKDLLPRLQDAQDVIATLSYYLGLSKVRPKFGRFSYVEKSEYWALVWGTLIMGLTGVIMWFDNTFIDLLTKLGYDVARTVHYYEAWLATLAIIIWHLYFVIFNPDVYPLNLAFWKGTLTEEEMADEHALELEELHRQEIDSALEEEQFVADATSKPEKDLHG